MQGMSEEAIREAVLLETLSRLLREKIGADGASPVPPWRRPQAEAGALSATSANGSAVPPEEPAATPVTAADVIGATSEIKREAPLEKFIRVFRLDELAAKCLLKLQDDEAAFVIESIQHRLKYAKNPSAVVMIAIRGVAAKVGRRYYGSRETAEGGESHEGAGDLKMIGGSPEDETETAAQTDPYLAGVNDDEEEDEEEEEQVVDEEVEPASRQGASEPPLKKPRADVPEDRLTVEVWPKASPDEDPEPDDAELFFVDTGIQQ
ncbi:unnamed protein product [Symbiodinium microadriaticum]|nr:unnamed protein product [Symbiodinium microadriaticum]CAE7848820.1 unnamed protein product [Symbiodinium sp. KB8]